MSDNGTSDCYWSFGDGIEYVLGQIKISRRARKTYTSDAQFIQNAFIRAISERDITFKGAFKGLHLAGSYLDQLKLFIPDEFDLHVLLSMPFDIEPVWDIKHSGYAYLKVKDRHINHPIVNGGYLQRICCKGGRVYKLEYTSFGYGCAHTILATEKYNPSRQISFDFVPVFAFFHKDYPLPDCPRAAAEYPWYAVPQKYRGMAAKESHDYSFMVCAPQWERLVFDKKMNLKNSLRLMKAFRDAQGMSRMISYFLKSLYLQEVGKKQNCFWNQSPGRLLIRMLVILLFRLRSRHLPFYLAPQLNHFEGIPTEKIKEYTKTVRYYLRYLIKLRDRDEMDEDDINNIFGV